MVANYQTHNQLGVGDWIEFQGDIFKYEGLDLDDPLIYLFHNIDTLATTPISYSEFCSATPSPIFAKSKAELDKKIIAISELAEKQMACFDENNDKYQKAMSILDKVIIIDSKLDQLEQNYLLEWQLRNKGNGNILPPKFNKTETLLKICDEIDISKTTYYDYKKRLSKCHNDPQELALTLGRKTRGITKFDSSTIHFVDTLIMREYASKNRRIKKSFFYEEILKGIHKELDSYWLDLDLCTDGIPLDLVDSLLDPKNPNKKIIIEKNIGFLKKIGLPKKSWTYNYLNWFSTLPGKGKKVIDNRYGNGVWENEFEIFDTYIYQAEYPLQFVFADHAYLDIYLVDNETRKKKFRIWLTILIDAFSRSIVGYHLSHKSPSIDSIVGAIKSSIIEKSEILQKFNIDLEWPCVGKPWSLSLDNAWAHRSHTLEELARYLGISLDYRPPYKARYGAIVEKAFGYFQGMIKTLFPGGIVNPRKKGKINAFHEAAFVFEDLEEFILRMIVNYQNRPHSGLFGETPNFTWKRGANIIPPKPISITPVLERKMWKLLPGKRVIGKKGISCFNLKYSSNQLKSRGVQKGFDGKSVEYRISVNENDISKIALWDMSGTLHTHPINGKSEGNGNLVCDVYAKELRLSNNEYFKISISAYEFAKALQKEMGGGKKSHWLELLYDIKERREFRKKENRSIGNQKKNIISSKSKINSTNTSNTTISRKENDRLTKLLSNFNN